MDITFKFAIGQVVRTALGVTGRVISASRGRGDVTGYWIEYIDSTGKVSETYVPESEVTAG